MAMAMGGDWGHINMAVEMVTVAPGAKPKALGFKCLRCM